MESFRSIDRSSRLRSCVTSSHFCTRRRVQVVLCSSQIRDIPGSTEGLGRGKVIRTNLKSGSNHQRRRTIRPQKIFNQLDSAPRPLKACLAKAKPSKRLFVPFTSLRNYSLRNIILKTIIETAIVYHI